MFFVVVVDKDRDLLVVFVVFIVAFVVIILRFIPFYLSQNREKEFVKDVCLVLILNISTPSGDNRREKSRREKSKTYKIKIDWEE